VQAWNGEEVIMLDELQQETIRSYIYRLLFLGPRSAAWRIGGESSS
jgi:hypothetical protein